MDEAKIADAVFAGEVLARRDSVVRDTLGLDVVESPWNTILVVNVIRTWKGLRADTMVTMLAGSDTGLAPKRDYLVNGRYLIYASSLPPDVGGWYAIWGGRLYAGGRTGPLWSSGTDLRQLGLVAADTLWLKRLMPSKRDSIQLVPLADSLAKSVR